MDSMDHISSDRTGGHHLSKHDDTPMPLRISKKREARKSDHDRRQHAITNVTLPTLQTVPTVPSRQASLPRGHTQPGVLHEKSNVSSAQLSNEIQSLHVLKQRNMTTASANSINPEKTHHCGTAPPTRIQGCTQLSSKNEAPFSVERTQQRANTTGFILSSDLLISPFHDGPLIPPAPTPLVTRSRSFATVMHGSKREITKQEPDDQPANQGISRKNSLRGRFMSRVMNGLTSKQKTSDAPMELQGTTQLHSDETTTKHRNEIAAKRDNQPSRQRGGQSTHNHVVRTVPSRLNSNSLIDTTLSALPTPPVIATMTSSTTYPSMTTTHAAIEMPGSSHTFEGAAVVGAEINVVPETIHLKSDDAQSFFVAVEIKGTLNDPEEKTNLKHHGLEVGVVIDNS